MLMLGRHSSIMRLPSSFNILKSEILVDLSKESYAFSIGKLNYHNPGVIIDAFNFYLPSDEGYINRNQTFLNLRKEISMEALSLVQSTQGMNTIIDIHSHPFHNGKPSFSSEDDLDEKRFFRFLIDNFNPIINYASIVISRDSSSARFWTIKNNRIINDDMSIHICQ